MAKARYFADNATYFVGCVLPVCYHLFNGHKNLHAPQRCFVASIVEISDNKG